MKNKVLSRDYLVAWIELVKIQNIDISYAFKDLISDKEISHISFDQYTNVVSNILSRTNDNELGIKAGKFANIGILGIVGQILKLGRTIGEGLQKAIDYSVLLSNIFNITISNEESNTVFTFSFDEECYNFSPEVAQQSMIAWIIFIYKEVFLLTQNSQQPKEANINFDLFSFQKLSETLCCPIKKGVGLKSNEMRLVFEKGILDKKNVFSDYELMLQLEQLARQRIQFQKENLNNFSDHIKLVIYSLLDSSFPELKTVASQLNLSERTVQRKLKYENTTYSQIVLDLKKSIAEEYLKQRYSVKEVAYLLGYSESSAFVNAFKNWYGISPQNYRDKYLVISN